MPPSNPTLRLAQFPSDLPAVREIFREYVRSPTADLGFQDYEREFADLPGKYAAPRGCVLLAWAGDELLGCGALRPVDDGSCEMKRVYLRPAARGRQLGRQLVERLLAEAREAGYRRICLDVLPEFVAARRLYASLGFVPAPPVSFNPVPGTLFLALELTERSAAG